MARHEIFEPQDHELVAFAKKRIRMWLGLQKQKKIRHHVRGNNLKNDLNINEQYTLKETMATKTEIIDKINKDTENKKSINDKPMKINQILKIKLQKDDPSNTKKGKTPMFSWKEPRNQSPHYTAKPTNTNF